MADGRGEKGGDLHGTYGASDTRRRRRGRISPAFAFRFAYFAGNAIILSIVYTTRSSALYLEGGSVRDGAVEAWMWIAVVASWIAYLYVQGSNPGYIIPGAELLPPAPAPAAGEAKGEAVMVTVPLEAEGAGTGPPSSAAAASAAGLFGSRDQAGVDLMALSMDGDADYDPEHAADPASVKSEALAAAQHGERQCRFCHARQPARAHHCRQCNKCVHTFDHHCMWIGTCIGERNRCRFWWYLFTQSFALAYGIGLLNTGFVWRRTTSEWAEVNILTLLTIIVLWIMQLFVFGLLVFHTWLAATNTTSFEARIGPKRLWYLEGTQSHECDIPYSHGLTNNVRLFCCIMDARPSLLGMCKRTRREDTAVDDGWRPQRWSYPGTFERNSTDVWNNLWENRYWSCC